MKIKVKGHHIDIYYPFLDNILCYDCQECGYDCCKDGFIISDLENKKFLLNKYPFLEYLVAHSDRYISSYHKFSTRCWFLDTQNKCFIQKKYGRINKPIGCRLHPFNLIHLDKKNIVIKIEYCPGLKLLDGQPKVKNIARYKDLTIDIKDALNKNYQTLFKLENGYKEFLSNWNIYKKLVAYIRDNSCNYLDDSNPIKFAAFQVSANDLFMTKGNLPLNISSSLIMENTEMLNSFAKKCSAFLDIPKGMSLENPTLSRQIIALYPFLSLFQNEFLMVPPPVLYPKIFLAFYIHTCFLIYRTSLRINLMGLMRLYRVYSPLYESLSQLEDTPFLFLKKTYKLSRPNQAEQLGQFFKMLENNRSAQKSFSEIIKCLNLKTIEDKILFLEKLQPYRKHFFYLEDAIRPQKHTKLIKYA